MLRGKLADEGMLNEDICLGTKATMQRSETWKKKKSLISFSRFSNCECVFFLKFLWIKPLLLAEKVLKKITKKGFQIVFNSTICPCTNCVYTHTPLFIEIYLLYKMQITFS